MIFVKFLHNSAISEDEKTALRRSLIVSFDEPVHQVLIRPLGYCTGANKVYLVIEKSDCMTMYGSILTILASHYYIPTLALLTAPGPYGIPLLSMFSIFR